MIIDNENKTMLGRLQKTMPMAKKIDIAVGYFFVSGFAQIMDSLKWIENSNDPNHMMRILTSPITDRITAEAQFAAHEALQDIERNISRKNSPADMLKNTTNNIKHELEHMPQAAKQKEAVKRIINLISRKKLEIRVYTREQLHAKLYLLKLDGLTEEESIIGSSNFSISGLRTHAELNLSTNDDLHYEGFLRWYNDHWEDPSCKPFTKDLAKILENSWAGKEYSPRMMAGKASMHENPEALDDVRKSQIELYEFQRGAVNEAIRKIDDYGGVIIADVVGMGKSYMGAAVLKHLVDSEILEPLVICPARLKDMWYEILSKHGLAPNVLSNSKLDDLARYNYCNAILIDESHAFKDSTRSRYEKLAEYMDNKMTDAKIIMLTATPISNTVMDLKNQLNIFQPDIIEKIPILEEVRTREGRTKIDGYFEGVENLDRTVTPEGKERIKDLLKYVLIRRTRKKILDGCKKDENDRPYLVKGESRQYFPERRLHNLEYDAEKTYDGKFREIELSIESLKLARYVPGNYIKDDWKDVEPYSKLRDLTSLGGIVMVSLLKRMESSIEAFDSSINRYERGNEWFLGQLVDGKVSVGKNFREIIKKLVDNDSDNVEVENELIAEMGGMTSEYESQAFKMDEWIRDVSEDVKKFGQITKLLKGSKFVTRDDKLHKLLDQINKKQEKLLIFTESSVTARYIFEFIKANIDGKRKIEQLDSSKKKNVIKEAVIRFAPKFNGGDDILPEEEIDILISTDVLAEGLNLQAGRVIINYDFHWNPVRLIQRVGRIDRIGSDHEFIEVYNFLTTPLVDKSLGLRERVRKRIDAIREILGTSSQVLEDTEPPDADDVCDMYDGKESMLDPKIGGILDPIETEAEKMAEEIRKNEQIREQYENLPYGIRSSVGSSKLLVACSADDILDVSGTQIRATKFKKYYEVTGDSIRRIRQSSFMTQIIESSKKPQIKEPKNYDEFITRAWSQFREDSKNSMRYVSIHKYQKYFDGELKRIHDKHLQRRVLEMRRFVKSRMLQSLHPYRELVKLHQEAKKEGMSGEQILDVLEEIHKEFGNIHLKKIIKKPQILYSMMVSE